MNEISKDIRVMFMHYRPRLMIAAIIALVLLGFTIASMCFGVMGYLFSSNNYLFVCESAGIILALPFVNQFQMFPYLISMGEKRSNYFISAILMNLIIIAGASFIASFVFGLSAAFVNEIYNGNFGLFIGHNLLNMFKQFGYYTVLFGFSSAIASIFYKKGSLYGSSAILLILSLPMLFKERIFDYLFWYDAEDIKTLIMLIILSAILLMFSWIFIRNAEIKN